MFPQRHGSETSCGAVRAAYWFTPNNAQILLGPCWVNPAVRHSAVEITPGASTLITAGKTRGILFVHRKYFVKGNVRNVLKDVLYTVYSKLLALGYLFSHLPPWRKLLAHVLAVERRRWWNGPRKPPATKTELVSCDALALHTTTKIGGLHGLQVANSPLYGATFR